MSKVIVFGVSGYAGGHIAKELVARDFDVTGVARRAEALPAEVNSVVGSIHDEPFVREVVEGASQIVVALPASATQEGGPALLDALPLLEEVSRAQGARLSFVGGAGSLAVTDGGPQVMDAPGFPEAFKGEALAHANTLEALRSADEDLDWFSLSPAAGFGSWNAGERTGEYRVGRDVLIADADGNSNISGADFALAYVNEIERREHVRARFTVAY